MAVYNDQNNVVNVGNFYVYNKINKLYLVLFPGLTLYNNV